jgi:hypothetical protein
VGFAVMCQLASTPSALYAVSVRRLAHLHSGFLQTGPRGPAVVASLPRTLEIMGNRDALRLPVVSLAAEHMALAYLMRRNILAYKAPPNNAGYDLICIHPDSKQSGKIVRVQVKSRYQSDSDRAFPVKGKIIDSFDFLMVVFLNIGKFYRGSDGSGGKGDVEIYTLPQSWIREHHYSPKSGFEKVRTKGHNLDEFKNDVGIEQIAKVLQVAQPLRLEVGRADF